MRDHFLGERRARPESASQSGATLPGGCESYAGGLEARLPAPVQAPQGAPNILLILIDDAGFGNPSTFGGPVQTPTLDRLARDGLRYNRFHVTALCSPTRAALLSGRNHHAVGFGSIAEAHSGWPGYNAMWPRSAASIAEILRDSGYSTGVFGKWHLTPDTLPVRRHDREGGLRAALSRRSVVRDEYGRRTAAFVVVRRAMGMPP